MWHRGKGGKLRAFFHALPASVDDLSMFHPPARKLRFCLQCNAMRFPYAKHPQNITLDVPAGYERAEDNLLSQLPLGASCPVSKFAKNQ